MKKKPGLVGAIKNIFHSEYETKTAVDDISFKINKGEILGYIGPNGAVKSTTMENIYGRHFLAFKSIY